MKLRCWPGAVCRVDRTSPGLEANIGALITVTRQAPIEARVGGVAAWEFTEASRVLLVRDVDSRRIHKVRSSGDLPGSWVWFLDEQLTPITPPPGTVMDDVPELTTADIAAFFSVPAPANV